MNIAQFYLNLAFDKVREVCMEATLRQCSSQSNLVKVKWKSMAVIYKSCWQVLEHFQDTVCFLCNIFWNPQEMFCFFISWCFDLFSQVHWNVQQLNFRTKNKSYLCLRFQHSLCLEEVKSLLALPRPRKEVLLLYGRLYLWPGSACPKKRALLPWGKSSVRHSVLVYC